MSNMINVNGSEDPAYRYKMPRLVGKIEGRGNGIKTVIVNASEIAASLHRPTAQVTKFFGCELGAMSKYDEKTDRSIVNGAFETKDLQQMLFKYIELFLLCPSCGNPETEMEVKGKKKSAMIWLKCKACGSVNEADNTHGVCTFIVKNASEMETGLSKEERRRRKLERKAAQTPADGNSISSSVGVDESRANSASTDPKKEMKKKKKSKKNKKEKGSDEDKERKRKKKEKKRKEKERAEAAAAGGAALNTPEEDDDEDDGESSANSDDDDDDNDDNGPVATLEKMTIDDIAAIDTAVESITPLLEAPDVTQEAILEAVKTQQTNRGLRQVDRISILFFAAVAGQSPGNITKNAKYLTPLVTTFEDQVQVLVCLEESVVRAEPGQKQNTAMTVTIFILKALYDSDILDEDTILKWYSGTLKIPHISCTVPDEVTKKIKETTKPFVDWLQQADEGDSEEDDDEDQDED